MSDEKRTDELNDKDLDNVSGGARGEETDLRVRGEEPELRSHGVESEHGGRGAEFEERVR